MGAFMTGPDAEAGKDSEQIVLGTPEDDGDFESDGLPDSGETSAGGQVTPAKDAATGELSGLEKVIDEISNGTLQP
jgi:hypothetical protein